MTGEWVGASYVLGRPVPVDEPYPHICGVNVAARVSRNRRVILWRRDCAACVQQEHDERQQPDVDQLPAVDPDITAAERRRLGDHD